MLYVRARRTRRTTWRAAKEALVAMIMDGVGPGVNMEFRRSVRKVAMRKTSKARWIQVSSSAYSDNFDMNVFGVLKTAANVVLTRETN